MKITVKNREEMRLLATKIAQSAKKGDVIGLVGTLGAGKSFFASAFINALSEKPIEVLSPTFNLVYTYQTKPYPIYHFDLYRLKNPNELENIGLFEALTQGITLIEWPQLAHPFLKKNYREIQIKITGEEERVVEIGK